MFKSLYFLPFFASIATGCQTTKLWVVQQSPDGGKVAYTVGKEFDAEKKFSTQLKKIGNSICMSGRWETGLDILKSETRNGTLTLPYEETTTDNGTVSAYGSSGGYATANYSGTSTTTKYKTTNYQKTDYWREVELHCLPTFAQERKPLEPKCEAKDAETCYEIARIFQMEMADNKDEYLVKKSTEFMKKSCEAGLKSGCGWVKIYAGDVIGGEALLKEGCADDEPRACHSLAGLKYRRVLESVNNDPKKVPVDILQDSANLLRKACSLDLERSCRLLKGFQKDIDSKLAH